MGSLIGILKISHYRDDFTANGNASQRSEGINSDVKCDPTTKLEMRNWHFYQFLQHFDSIQLRKEMNAVTEITKLLTHSAAAPIVSKKVQTYIDSMVKLSQNFKSPINLIAGLSWRVEPYGSLGEAKDIRGHPIFLCTAVVSREGAGVDRLSCVCGRFSSSKLPCEHVAKVAGHLGMALISENQILKRWQIQYHPQYAEAMCKSGLAGRPVIVPMCVSSETLEDAAKEATAHELAACNRAYQAVKVKSTEVARYAQMLSSFKDLGSICQGSTHKTKLALLGLKKLQNEITEAEDPTKRGVGRPLSTEAFASAPKHKRKQTNEPSVNMANLHSRKTKGKSKKKEKKTTCTLCHEIGHTAAGCPSNREPIIDVTPSSSSFAAETTSVAETIVPCHVCGEGDSSLISHSCQLCDKHVHAYCGEGVEGFGSVIDCYICKPIQNL